MTKVHVDLKVKLRATIEAKRIARTGLEEAEKKFDELVKLRKKLKAKKQDFSRLDVMIEVLGDEIDKISEAAANAQHGCPIDGGVGFGSGGGAGTDSG
jgi:t-SNARE complex subunit (syntaxin)